MHASSSGSVVTIEPRIRRPNNPVVYCHGAGGTSLDLAVLAQPEQPPRRLVSYGYSVIATTLAIEDWWGTREGVAATRRMIGVHRATLGGTGPVVLYGGSMGAATAIQTALVDPSDVACIVLVIPCLDIEHQRQVSPTLRAYINESWDMTPIETNLRPLPRGANPIDRAKELSGVPILMFCATDDDISYGYQSFAASHGATTIVSLGARGHTVDALRQVDPDRVGEFVRMHT